jgi:acyl-CoA synthetase (AMP-forming)/AMP-acid ligase II
VLQLAAPELADWVALEHGGTQVTIKELAGEMCRAAGALAGSPGVVAVSTPDPILHTVAVLGAVAAGRTALLVDPKQPDGLLADVAQLAGATTTVGRPVAGLPAVTADDLRAAPPAAPAPAPGDRIGSIFLTSGSTGLPKLVQRSRSADLHAAMCLRLAGFPIDLGDRHWLSVPYAGAPFLTLLMGSLLARATVVIAPFSRASVDQILREHRISSAYLVPTMLRLAREHDGLDGAGWRGLRGLMTGGEKLDDATARLLLERFPGRVFCAYGMTESPRLTQATLEEFVARPGTVGRTIPFRQARIVEPGGEGAVPAGQEGEVLVAGPDLFTGYVGQPPTGAWYRTGDLGRIDADGYLYITGRASSVVKVGGNRVSTEEVSAMLRAHDDVAQAAVIALDDPTWTTRLVGFVVARAGTELDATALRDWMAARQPGYKVPRAIHLLAELPVDSSGKLSLRRLEELAGATDGAAGSE